jgi:hypothetical protein
MQMSWTYIAGFFDGEGCIGFYPAKNTTRVLVEMCQAEPREHVLFEIQGFCASQGINLTHRVVARRGNHAPTHKLYTVNRAVASEFLKRVEPYLHVKLLKAQEMIAWADENPTRRGARPRPIKKSTVKEMIRLQEEGMSQQAIADKFGFNQVYVGRVLRRHLTIPV